MADSVRRTIVVSGVNLRKGGTLAIMRQCLQYLSQRTGELRVVALVHKKELFDAPGIEYIEIPWSARGWGRRLWCEYVTMHRISKEIAAQDGRKVWMWLSMHDTTPRVEAEHQEVYCHTSFPFLKCTMRDFRMDPKIPLFSKLTRWAYRINVHRNDFLIVQQEWFRDALSDLLKLPREKFKVIPPQRKSLGGEPAAEVNYGVPMFFYASTPDCHKNFETLCEAARLLEGRLGKDAFKVVLTIKGDENRYARWLHALWGSVQSIDFHGFMTKPELLGHYKAARCFVFPSRVETWGLPISEYMEVGGGPMLLADLPYAHETSVGACGVKFFEATDAETLCEMMYESIAAR